MTATVSHDLAVAGGGVLLIAAVLIVVGRALARRGASPLVTRKIPHALCGLFAALAAFQLSHGVVVAGVLAAATVALTVIVERGLIPVPGVFDGTRSRDYGLVAFAGMDPRPRDSGTKRGQRRLSKRGPAEGRRLLFNAAMAGIKSPVWAPRYEQCRARGLASTEALIAIARKMLRVAFTLYKTQTDFNPALMKINT